MKELIKQLRDIADNTVLTKVFSACTAAADTIEDLQKKLDRIPEKKPDKWDLEMMLQAARAELEEVKAERDKLRCELTEAQAIHDACVKTFSEKIDALEQELKEVEALREAELNTAEELSISNLSMHQELNALRLEHDRLKKQLDHAKYESKKDYDQMREFQAKFIEADQERRALKQELEDERDLHDRLQDFELAEARDLSTANEANAFLRKENNRLASDIESLKAQLAASFDREIKLKNELDRRITVHFCIGAGR